MGQDIVDIFYLVTGSPPENQEELLRQVDALGMLDDGNTRDTLRRCGTKLYNILRAIEPVNADLLRLRIFSIRCLEAGARSTSNTPNTSSSLRANVLLCYVRTGLKLLSLSKTKEVPNQELSALGCLRRGFAFESLNSALAQYKNPENSMTREMEDYAASIFEGAVELTNLEIEVSDNANPMTFLCSLWCEVGDTLSSVVQVEFRSKAKECMRKLALAFYARGTNQDFECSLKLFTLMGHMFPVETLTTLDDLNDLLIISEMQIALGDRGLAQTTLDKVQTLRVEMKTDHIGPTSETLNRITWKDLDKAPSSLPESSSKPTDNVDKLILFAHSINEGAVRFKLALAETKALDGTKTMDEETSQMYQVAVDNVHKSFSSLLETAQSTPKLDESTKDFTELTFNAMRTCCRAFCDQLGYSNRNVQTTFLRVADLSCMNETQRISLCVEVLEHIPKEDGMVGMILERISTAKDILPNDRQSLVAILWRRLEYQETTDVDGAILTATFLVEFSTGDPVLVGYCHASLARNVYTKTKDIQDVEHKGRLLAKVLENCKAALDIFKNNPDKHVYPVLDAMVASFKASLEVNDLVHASSTLTDIIQAPVVTNQVIAELALKAVSSGVLGPSIELLEKLVVSNRDGKQKDSLSHHLVSLRLTQAGLSPTMVTSDCLDAVDNVSIDQNALESIATDMDRCCKDDVALDDYVLAWLQVCSWNLAKKYIPNLSCANAQEKEKWQGTFYCICATLSSLRLRQCEVKEEEEERLRISRVCGIACLADMLIKYVIFDGGLVLNTSEAGIVPAEEVFNKVLSECGATISRLRNLLKLSNSNSGQESFVECIGQFVLTELTAGEEVIPNIESITFANSIPCNKLVQIGLFCKNIGHTQASNVILRSALQREIAAENTDGVVMGKILVLLVKQSESDKIASQWIEQAVQLCENFTFSQQARGYLSTWAWNFAVKRSREQDGTPKDQVWFDSAIKILTACPDAHPDKLKAGQLQQQVSHFVNKQ